MPHRRLFAAATNSLIKALKQLGVCLMRARTPGGPARRRLGRIAVAALLAVASVDAAPATQAAARAPGPKYPKPPAPPAARGNGPLRRGAPGREGRAMGP